MAFPHFRYLDCEDPGTAEFLREDPRYALQQREGAGLIIDEAQAVPAVFSALRGLIDSDRGRNRRFVILGSAQPTLVRGVAESLAGRAAVIELDPLAACEAAGGDEPVAWKALWLKGGFPDAARGASWETFVIEDILRREAVAHPGSQAYFWRTAAGAEVDLVIERAEGRVAVQAKTARGGSARAVRPLREALPDIGAARAWIVDQASGIERLADNIACAGFGDLLDGVPE